MWKVGKWSVILLAWFRYVRRKAKEGFRAHKGETDAQKLSELLQDAKQELEVVKRQSLVYSMYARRQKSIMVCPLV